MDIFCVDVIAIDLKNTDDDSWYDRSDQRPYWNIIEQVTFTALEVLNNCVQKIS